MCSEGYSSCFVILSVCLSVCLLPRFLPLRATRRPISDANGFSATLHGFIFKIAFFVKMLHSKVMGVKQSEEANMQISTGLPLPPLRTLEAPEVAMQSGVDSRVLSTSVASQRLTLSKMVTVSDHELYKN